jgi:uncharacterized phage protein (TIGR02218 family)
MAKTVPAALQTHLDREVTSVATCWAIRRVDGVVLFFTDHDQDLDLATAGTFPVGPDFWLNNVYVAQSGHTRSAISSRDGTVPDAEVEAVLSSDYVKVLDLEAGLYDNAEFYMFKVNWDNLANGALKMPASGTIGEVTVSPKAGVYKTEMKGVSQCLQHKIGGLYSPTCRVDLFSYQCKLDESLHVQHGTITAVTDSRSFDADITAAGFASAGLTIPHSDFASAGAPPPNWTEEIVQGAGQFNATTFEARTVCKTELQGPHDKEREFTLVSAVIPIPGGVPTADIDNGLAVIDVSADIESPDSSTDPSALEDSARLGVVFFDTNGDEIGRQVSPLIREFQHGLTFNAVNFTRRFQVQALARSVKIMLVAVKERYAAQPNSGIIFDNVAATVLPQPVLSIPGAPFDNTFFDGGYIVFNSGQHRAKAYEVETFTIGTFTLDLFIQLPITPTVGAQFTFYPGCTKRHIEDCVTKWENVLNFRGEPYVPSQDDAFKSADFKPATVTSS